MCEAVIARTLVEKDPSLLLPSNKDKLLNDIRSIYENEHVVRVTRSEEDMALARMRLTDENHLPRA